MANEVTATAFFSLLLLLIQDRIKNELPEILWDDQDMGQLESYEIKPAVEFPCTLIDFLNTTYDQMGNQEQWGNQFIQFKLGFAPFSSTNSATPVKYRQKALEYYELEDKLYKVFQGWDADGLCQPLTRISAVKQERNDKYRARVITFSTTFQDDGATLATVKANRPDLVLDIDDDGE